MEKQRTKCLVYTRVMWYLSPTYRYNVGKKSEFYSRKYFDKEKAKEEKDLEIVTKISNIKDMNKSFSLQYA